MSTREDNRRDATGARWTVAAVAVSLAIALPLWRASLPLTYYRVSAQIPSTIRPFYLVVALGLALILAAATIPAARKLADCAGRSLGSFSLLGLAVLLLIFQHSPAVGRWIASLVAIPVSVVAWGALAQRSGEDGRPVDFATGWFLGLVLDLFLRGAANTYDFLWQRNPTAYVVVGVLAAAGFAVAGFAWPRQTDEAARHSVAVRIWLGAPVCAVLALAGSQNVGALGVELGLSLPGALCVCLGVILIGWGIARGAGATPALAEVAACCLLLAIAILSREWETLCVALLGPVIIGGLLLGAASPVKSGNPPPAGASAFGGVLLAWFSLHLAGYAEDTLGREARALDVFWLGAVALAVARGMTGAPRPARDERWALASVVGGVLLMVSILPPSVAAGSRRTLPGERVVAMTYNIHRAVGPNFSIELEAIGNVMGYARSQTGLDVAGLQEVTRGRKLEAGIDELGWLSDRLAMNSAFTAVSGSKLGVAVLSRAPIGEWRSVRLRTDGDVSNAVLWAMARFTPPLGVVVARMDDDANVRRFQAEELGRGTSTGDVVLLLDLAMAWRTRTYSQLTDQGRWTDAFQPTREGGRTYPADSPADRRDFVLFRGQMTVPPEQAQVLSSRIPASTHNAVLVPFVRTRQSTGL